MKRRRKLLKIKSNKKKEKLYAKIDWNKASLLFQKPPEYLSQKKLVPATKDVLHVLAGVGAIGLLFAFPGAAAGIGAIMLGNNSYSRWGTKRVINQLSKQKYVSIKENENGEMSVIITKKGMQRALTYQLDTIKITPPKRWDKRWRVVIFDVPERHKKLRDAFRMRLRQMSLYPLQESVYVSPYPCFNEVEFLRELFGVAFSVKYLVVQKIEDDEFLLRHFDLTKD